MAEPQQLQFPRQQTEYAWATRWNIDCAKLQSFMAARKRRTVEPPHEPAGSTVLADLHAACKFYDGVSGAPLDHAMATAARKTEIEFCKSRGVYTKVRHEPWMKIISTKWLAQNKSDHAAPNYRSRLFGCEFVREKRDDLFAATPPPESLRAILAFYGGQQSGREPHRVMALDVA